MNEKIKSNLKYLLNTNLEIVKNSSIQKMFDELISENPNAFDFNLGIISNLFDNEEIKSFKKAKKNPRLLTAFQNIKKMELDEKQIIEKLKRDILNSISEIKSNIESENNGLKNQGIFLEYDYEPSACFSGFGKGNYPILKEPEYFDFNSDQELYSGIGLVDYKDIWQGLIAINEILEDLEIFDQVWDTELYQALLNSVKFKTYLLLNSAFEEIGIDAFEGIEIETPLMIYGNEHGCEPMNIYSFE